MAATSFIIIVAVVVFLVIMVAVNYVPSRRKTQRREELRGQASQHRDLADITQIEADRRRAEAEELAARPA